MHGNDEPTVARSGETTVRLETPLTIANRYELLQRLGEGGFGTVYRARDTLLRRDVALKLLGAAQSPDASDRFLPEARATARLQHPNIVSIFDAGEDAAGRFLVLELVNGTSLAAQLRSGPLSPDRARAITTQVAAALSAAHDAGVVHRDVKPPNILMTDDDQVKVADFGIARIAGESQLTVTGGVVGTPRYMAPEQVEGEAITPATDLFALGLVLYEMLTGETAFRGATMSEIVANIVSAKWTRPPDKTIAIAPDLWRLVECLLQKDSGNRGTAADALNHLRGKARRSAAKRIPMIATSLTLVAVLVATFTPVRRMLHITAVQPSRSRADSRAVAWVGGYPQPARVYTGKPISLHVENKDIHELMRFFAHETGLNVAVDNDVRGNVTVDFVAVPWDQALDTVLNQCGLTWVLEGKVMRIARVTTIMAEKEREQRLRQLIQGVRSPSE